jgi:hypothetical protein
MTDQQHSITPPPELFAQWGDDILNSQENVDYVVECAWRNGFQAGADQELEACCAYLAKAGLTGDACGLQLTRRPKPPSLKEQALMALEDGDIGPGASLTPVEVCIIRRALEQLDD